MLRSPAKSVLALELVLVALGLAISFGLASCSRSAGPAAALTAPGRSGGGTFAPKPPPGNPVLQSLAFFPATIEGGAPATGRITFDRVTDGALVSLTSSDPTVLVVPSETVVPGQEQSGDYAITTNAVSAPVTITVNASTFGGETTLSATVTVVPATGPPVPDVVTIKSMTWRLGHLKISASSDNPNAILSAWLTNSDSFMFNLHNDGRGRYSDERGFNTNPQFITIKSNFGGSADGTTIR
jgi:hypothetical protein